MASHYAAARTQNVAVTLASPLGPLTYASPTAARVGTAFAAPPTSTPTDLGPGETLSYSVTPALPHGLVLDATGTISGTLSSDVGNGVDSTVGAYAVTATGSSGRTVTATLTIAIKPQSIAQQFRPVLLFDSGETWRPLNVDLFLAEGLRFPGQGSKVCGNMGDVLALCPDVLGAATLQQVQGGYPHLVPFYNPAWAIQGAPGYASPDPACRTTVWLDCDTGPSSAYYYAVKQGSDNETYYEYWGFWRYNQWDRPVSNGIQDDHEGDWDSHVAVATHGTNPRTFDFVAFAAHDGYWRYLRGATTCDWSSNPGSCGTEAAPAGDRVNVYVAQGTHAAYPQPCSSDPCLQTDGTGDSLKPDNAYDGAWPWGNNDVASALLEMPATGGWTNPSDTSQGTWTDWPGHWGTTLSDGEVGAPSPASPGNQANYKDPASWNCTERFVVDFSENCNSFTVTGKLSDATTALSARVPLLAPGATRASTAPAGTRASTMSVLSGDRTHSAEAACKAWAGPGVSMVVCDPRAMLKSQHRASYMRSRAPGVLGLAAGSTSAAVPGLTQVVGPPISSTRTVSVVKALSPGTFVVLRVRGPRGRVTMLVARVRAGARHGVRIRAVAKTPRAGVASEQVYGMYLSVKSLAGRRRR